VRGEDAVARGYETGPGRPRDALTCRSRRTRAALAECGASARRYQVSESCSRVPSASGRIAAVCEDEDRGGKAEGKREEDTGDAGPRSRASTRGADSACLRRLTLSAEHLGSHTSSCIHLDRYWMHFHERVSVLLHQTIRLTSRSEHQPDSEPPCRCQAPPLHLSKVSRGVDPPRQFTFCCSTRFTPLPHLISHDPNDPASGNGRSRANELFVALPLWEHTPTHCAHSIFRAPK
jgi:hypothetical protein